MPRGWLWDLLYWLPLPALVLLDRLIKTPSYEQAAERVSAVVRNEDGAVAAADAIERVSTL